LPKRLRGVCCALPVGVLPAPVLLPSLRVEVVLTNSIIPTSSADIYSK
jgi:hypothetical protein